MTTMWVIARKSKKSPTGWTFFVNWTPLDGEDDEPELVPATSWFVEEAAQMPRPMAERVADRVRAFFPGYTTQRAP